MSAVAPSYLGSRHCHPRRPHPCRESSEVYTGSCDPHVPSPKSAETWQRPLNHYLVPLDFHVGSQPVKRLEVGHQDLHRTSARQVMPCSKKSERGSRATSKGSKLFQTKNQGWPGRTGLRYHYKTNESAANPNKQGFDPFSVDTQPPFGSS